MKEHSKHCRSHELPLLVAGGNLLFRECDCDGYHTFDELYDHRIALYIALCRVLKSDADHNGIWRSKLHSDGSAFDGWFILGIGKANDKQITYHLPLSRWGETEFAETLEFAPTWDGHTSADVLSRLKTL